MSFPYEYDIEYKPLKVDTFWSKHMWDIHVLVLHSLTYELDTICILSALVEYL